MILTEHNHIPYTDNVQRPGLVGYESSDEGEDSTTPASLPALVTDSEDSPGSPAVAAAPQPQVHFEDLHREAQMAHIVGSFNSMEIINMATRRMNWEGEMRQEAYRRLLEDAQVFKVCLAHHTLVTNDPYIKIYDLSFKVTQRLTGYLALDVTSLEKAERLFRYES